MPTFAIKYLGLPAAVAFLGSLLASTIQAVFIPVVGFYSDRYRRTTFALTSAIATLLLAWPLYALMVALPTLSTLLMVQAVLGTLNAISFGCLGGLIAGLFPKRVRTSGLSLGNALAQVVVGGTTPFVSLWLIEITGWTPAPCLCLMLGAIISLIALLIVRRQGPTH